MQVSCGYRRGFTLLELLVVIGVVAVLATLVLVAGRSVLSKARQAKCAGNLRQLGTAILSYTQDHDGTFPMTSHGLDASSFEKGWIFSLRDYLANVDEMRICPVDPKGEERLAGNGTSYLLNSFLTVPQVGPFGENLGGYTSLNQVPRPQSTPIAFIINFSRGAGMTNDHTHSESWEAHGPHCGGTFSPTPSVAAPARRTVAKAPRTICL
ncbi:type II secretion system protein [Verrucomicrobium spinosum]|uniref:type II secretion system protein n=1 Tax=Verrucomicrobium spinosum TaxID=2736 RepID=UPI0009463FD6|nr:type II secretion system protein [Verrucomicrobium spinosum]